VATLDDHDQLSLRELIHSDPDRVWPLVLEFARMNPDGRSLIEEFVYEHDERFIGRLEQAAMDDPVIRGILEEAYVGGVASPGTEQVHELQERLRSQRR
jgi:hypothetical protein